MFRNTDFNTLLLHAMWGGDKVSYPSEYGTIPGFDMDDFAVAGSQLIWIAQFHASAIPRLTSSTRSPGNGCSNTMTGNSRQNKIPRRCTCEAT